MITNTSKSFDAAANRQPQKREPRVLNQLSSALAITETCQNFLYNVPSLDDSREQRLAHLALVGQSPRCIDDDDYVGVPTS